MEESKYTQSRCLDLIDRLARTHSLTEAEYEYLAANRTPVIADHAAARARAVSRGIYGRDVFVRGIVEFSNICRNNCYYCGIRAGNSQLTRYRLTPEEILACGEEGYALGFRTLVLQSGEFWSSAIEEELAGVIYSYKAKFADAAVTLSLGELPRHSSQRLFDAGADRYLLRHETADRDHYRMLHPPEMSWEHRMMCLDEFREIGYDVGCGFMVGSPGQTSHRLAKDLKFVEIFRPEMCGIGPFIPHRDTPFGDQPQGTLEETLYCLSLIRLAVPDILLPATTALGTIDPKGREKGILAGANVIMPNLSPNSVRRQYELYDHKIGTDSESVLAMEDVRTRMEEIGYRVVTDRGDIRRRGRPSQFDGIDNNQ